MSCPGPGDHHWAVVTSGDSPIGALPSRLRMRDVGLPQIVAESVSSAAAAFEPGALIVHVGRRDAQRIADMMIAWRIWRAVAVGTACARALLAQANTASISDTAGRIRCGMVYSRDKSGPREPAAWPRA